MSTGAGTSWQSMRASARGSLVIVRRGLPLLLIGFAADAAFSFVFLIALQSYLPESLHQSEAIAGVALAAFGGAKLLTQVASGLVSDRLGARRALLIGTALLLAADLSIWVLAHTAPWLIVVAAAVEGLGSSVLWPALYSAGDARFAAGEKGRFTALLMLATGGALVAGIGGGTYLNTVATFNVAMIAPVAAVAGAAILSVFVAMPRSETEPEFVLPTAAEMRDIIARPQRAIFTALVLAEAAAIGALTAAFRAYGRDVLGVSLLHQALLLLPAVAAGGLIVMPGGVLADRIGAKRVMMPGFALTGVCLLVLSRWSDPAVVAPAAACAGLGFGLAVPAIASTMMTLAGTTTRRGGVIGWFMTMDGVGHAAGPAAAGLLLAISGAGAVLVAAGALFLAAAYLAAITRSGEAEARILPVETLAMAAEPVPGRTT